MKVSKLIERLQIVKDSFGDIEVGLDRADVTECVYNNFRKHDIALNYYNNYHEEFRFLGYINIDLEEE